MYSKNNVTLHSKKIPLKRVLIILMIIFSGLVNVEDFIIYIGNKLFSQIILLSLYSLIAISIIIILGNIMLRSKELKLTLIPYWTLLIVGIFIKYLILFVDSPSSIIIGGDNFPRMMDILLNVLILVILYILITSIDDIKVAIWTLGIVSLLATILPLIIFPDLVGVRIAEVNNYYFDGGVWNNAVIAFISVGWLLVALSEFYKSYSVKIILLLMFSLILLGGMLGLSRAVIIAFLISLLVYLFLGRQIKSYSNFIIILIILLPLSYYLFQDAIIALLDKLEGGIDISEESRVEIWRSYLTNITDYFWFGEISGNYKKYSIYNFGPHQVLLNWLVQYGIISLIGFLVLLISIYKTAKLLKVRYSKGISAAMFAWLICYLSVAMINETGFKDIVIFVSFGIILAWRKILILELKKTNVGM